MELHELSAMEAAHGLKTREFSSVELTQAHLDRIDALDSRISAYLTVTPEEALESAAAADKTRASNAQAASALLGVPIAIKDNICTRGIRTTCSSRMLENFIPPYDATVIARLKSAGMVILGKTNIDEFAMGSSTENSAFGPSRNPWNLECVPGGSSGGSTACVAAMEAPLALGSDTGGSIRQPASFCGVVGMKPTYSLVSRYGLIAFASSLDQIGPIARSVEDAAALMNVIAGPDPLDSTCWQKPAPDFLAGLKDGVNGMRVGVPKEYFVEGIDPEVEAAVRAAIQQYESLGASIVDISLPTTPYAVATYYICATAEASSNLARYDGAHYGLRVEADNIIDMFARTRAQGFGNEVKRRIMLGTYALSAGFYDAFYLKALKARTLYMREFEAAFQQCDFIACPTCPTPAFKFGDKVSDPLQMYLNDIFTIPCNLAGLPGISLPCGFSSGNLPIGLQLLAPAFEDAKMLRAAWAYEQAAGMQKVMPQSAIWRGDC